MSKNKKATIFMAPIQKSHNCKILDPNQSVVTENVKEIRTLKESIQKVLDEVNDYLWSDQPELAENRWQNLVGKNADVTSVLFKLTRLMLKIIELEEKLLPVELPVQSAINNCLEQQVDEEDIKILQRFLAKHLD